MKVRFNDKDYELHYSMRIFIMFEDMTNTSLSDPSAINTGTLVKLFYCTCLTTAKYNKLSWKLSYDDFIDWVDDQGGLIILNLFSEWFGLMTKVSNEIGLMLAKKPDPEEEDADIPKEGSTNKKTF